MSAELQRNNPLHGLKTEKMLSELVEFYGWKILYTAMRFHCFKVNPSIKASVKFLQKTEWARVKLENFYLYKFKRMPKPNPVEQNLAPRERGFAHGITPREPMKLTIESIELSQAKSASAYKERQNSQRRSNNRAKSQRSNQGRRDSGAGKQANYDPNNPWNK